MATPARRPGHSRALPQAVGIAAVDVVAERVRRRHPSRHGPRRSSPARTSSSSASAADAALCNCPSAVLRSHGVASCRGSRVYDSNKTGEPLASDTLRTGPNLLGAELASRARGGFQRLLRALRSVSRACVLALQRPWRRVHAMSAGAAPRGPSRTGGRRGFTAGAPRVYPEGSVRM